MAARTGTATAGEGEPAALAPALGLEAVEAALADDLPRVVVSPEDVEGLIAARATAFGDAAEDLETAGGSGGHERPELTNPYIAPNDERERRLALLWGSVLGLSEVGVLDNFFELGGTSLTGLQLVGCLRRDLGVELAAVDLYEAPTIRAMARLLERRSASESQDENSDDRQARGARRRARRRRS